MISKGGAKVYKDYNFYYKYSLYRNHKTRNEKNAK